MFDMSPIGRSTRKPNRRNFMAGAAMALLAGCAVVPKAPAPAPAPTPAPSEDNVIASDNVRHRVALLVPISGPNAGVGQSLANAANMAILDTGAKDLRITTYDTGTNPGEAARKAVADGNKLILGPLLADDIAAVRAVAKPAKVPLISFSNDEQAAEPEVFIIGNLPGQSVSRTIAYARQQGVSSFAALVPRGDYGERVSSALLTSVRASGGTVLAMENYDRTAASISAAATRIKAKGGFGALLIADSGTLTARAATSFRAGGGTTSVRLLGTELWSGEKALATTPALNGAWFSTVSDARFGQFSKSYRTRFGIQPFRIATLGYDAVLLTLRVSRDWKPGAIFPTAAMFASDGFLGVDGAFRFNRNGLIERALEVRAVDAGTVKVIDAVPSGFVKGK